MKLVFASDSFKGSLSSKRIAALLTQAATEVFGDCECVSLPVADGGEGTVEAVLAAVNGTRRAVRVHDPLMNTITACYGRFDGKAMIEMSAASGLPLVPEPLRDPLNTSTFGTGELILDALNCGCREIAVAIGGSATNDGGMGCATALGARFLDKNGVPLAGCGRDLIRVDRIDCSGMDARLKETRITILCDVTNPLCGANGATHTFARQKGASPETEEALEAGMCRYRDVIQTQFGIDCDAVAGAGAAGGLGAALMVFCGGEMRRGIEAVLDWIRFDEHLQNADLVVTGEGKTDDQTCRGKVIAGVGRRAAAKGVPVIGLSGSLGNGAEALFDGGIASLMTTVNAPMTLHEAMANAEALYHSAAVRMFRLIQTGMHIERNRP